MQVKLTVQAVERRCDVQLSSGADTTVEQLAPLLRQVVDASPGARLFSNGRPLRADGLLGDQGLRSGCVITVGSAGSRTAVAASVLQLRVVGGPDCGQLLALPRGRQLIGRGQNADLRLDDPDVSRRHAELCVDLRGATVRDLQSTNGTWLNGIEIGAEPHQVQLGALLRVGSSLLSVVAASEPPAAVTPDDSGNVLVHRPPRITELEDASAVEFPGEVAPSTRPRLRWLAALLPAGLGIACAVGMHSNQFLAFALLSPLTMLTGAASDQRDWRRGRHKVEQERAEAETAAQRELSRRLAAETSRRRWRFTDAAGALHAVSTPDCRLWERRRDDAGFLRVRLGLADQAADTRAVRSGTALPHVVVEAVPATVSLADGALGLAGPLPLARGSARWVIAQLLTLHSPRDLSVVALLDGRTADWRWLRWPSASVKAIATEPSEHQQLLSELVRLIIDRRDQRPVANWAGPWLVVLVDRACALAALDGLRFVLDEGPAVGITAVCVDEELRLLPPSCRSTASLTSDTGTLMEVCRAGEPVLHSVVTDRVSPRWADQLGRCLAPLRDGESDADAQLPTDVRLADLLETVDVSAQTLQNRWQRAASATTPIGMGASGPVEVDLLRDGPIC